MSDMAAEATVTTTAATQEKIPNWRVSGDWFDVCRCNIPCPCEFAQTRLMMTATVLWPIISKKVLMVKHPLMA